VQEDVHRCTVILIAAKAELGRQLLSFLNAGVHSDCFHEVYERLSPIQLSSGLSCGLACRRIGDNWRTFGNLVGHWCPRTGRRWRFQFIRPRRIGRRSGIGKRLCRRVPGATEYCVRSKIPIEFFLHWHNDIPV
jgi:hypothetical protein